jgi:hypothetical protein
MGRGRGVVVSMLAAGVPALGQDEGTSPADAADAVQAQEGAKAEGEVAYVVVVTFFFIQSLA